MSILLLLFSVQLYNYYQWITFDSIEFEKQYMKEIDAKESYDKIQAYTILFTIIPYCRFLFINLI